MSDPAGVVEALFSALSEQRWRDAAALFTPAFLDDFKHRNAAHAALDATEAWAWYLETTDPGTRYARVLDALKTKYPEHAAKLDGHSPRDVRWWHRYRVVGTVHDGPRAYVIARETLAQREGSPTDAVDRSPEMVVLRSTPAGWRVSSEPAGGRNLMIAGVSVQADDGRMVQLSL